MKRIKKKSKKKDIKKIPLAIFALGLVGIGFFPFRALKKVLHKKKKLA